MPADRKDDEAKVTLEPTENHYGGQATVTAEVKGIDGWTIWGECYQDVTDPDTGKVYEQAQVLWFGGKTYAGDQTVSLPVTFKSGAWVSGGAKCWVGVRNYDKSNYPRRTVYDGLIEFEVLP